MEHRVSVQGTPVGGVHPIRQSGATDTVTFHAGQNGLAIAVALLTTHAGWASVVKEHAAELFHEGGTDASSTR